MRKTCIFRYRPAPRPILLDVINGGVVDMDSRPGRTKFRVLLPVAHRSQPVDAEEVFAK